MADLATHGLLDGLYGPLCRLQCRLCTCKEDLSLRGQPDLSLSAIDQCRADFPLQVSHLFADRGLRYVEASSGSSETTGRCDRYEIVQMPKLHRCSVAQECIGKTDGRGRNKL